MPPPPPPHTPELDAREVDDVRELVDVVARHTAACRHDVVHQVLIVLSAVAVAVAGSSRYSEHERSTASIWALCVHRWLEACVSE